jgi:hypothetical protein
MMRKAIIVLLVLFGVFLAIGCTSNKGASPNNTVTPVSEGTPATNSNYGYGPGMMGNQPGQMGPGMMYPTFRRCLQKNNIFLAIVFGELFKNIQLISQLKLR